MERIIVFDFGHLARSYAYSGIQALSQALKVDGEVRVIDTTIPNYTIKTINRWCKNGLYGAAVCFDSKTSQNIRKSYFNGLGLEYKSGRGADGVKLYDGVMLTMNCLLKGGVSCYMSGDYEADDLVKACVDAAKENYPGVPIDVVTGDSDLLPLADEQVSVFLRSVKTTYAESKELEHNHYVQVTPGNFKDYVGSLAAYKSLATEYNTVLLAKLLRGDKTKGIKGIPAYTPRKYNALIAEMLGGGADLGKAFRYGSEDIRALLEKYTECTSDELDYLGQLYKGIELNGDLGGMRQPAVLGTQLKGYSIVNLQCALSFLRINL